MNEREQRGLALAALYRIDKVGGKYVVPSQRGDGTTYVVDPEARHCTCRDHEDRAIKCKHMFAVEFLQTRERGEDGTETVTRTFKVTEKVTYKQDWPNYNRAQTQEKRLFLTMLADLCRGIDEPRGKSPGRPRLLLSDVTFACVYKVYATLSARRFASDLQDAADKGHISKAPHFNVVIKHMDDKSLTSILKAMIVESSRPLAAVETQFAADSSGFSTSRFARWFDHKYGKTMEEREWVKVHLVCGVKTNVVTAVEILDKESADCPQLPALLKTTGKNFAVKELSADAAYSSQTNMEAVAELGGTPYIAFKENTTGAVGGLFAKMFHFYCFNKDEFLKHYHKRSNVESTFSMIKAKFRDHVRSRTDAGMMNEVLCKILCHRSYAVMSGCTSDWRYMHAPLLG
ncbi:transposase [Tundrisphaera lichenicola]|uniref:transposase n=1 Tax=Tundrisphaera lichenicola TaxID=2029860 RepID=UPI003EBA4A8A